MSCRSVLRIGPLGGHGEEPSKEENVAAKKLCDTLVKRFGVAAASTQSTASCDGKNKKLFVSNRYFSAEILLRSCKDSTGVVSPTKDETEKTTTEYPESEDGILLIFNNHFHPALIETQSSNDHTIAMIPAFASLESLEPFHNTAVDSGAGDLLRMCIGVTLDPNVQTQLDRIKGSKAYEDEYSKRILWCLDRGYEYVEADLSSPEALQRGHEERDKEGFARIVEAMEGTVWSSAVMASRKKKELQHSYQETRQEQTKEEKSSDTNNHAEPAQAQEYEPPNPSLLPPIVVGETDAAREEKARQAILKQSHLDSETVEEYMETTTAADSSKTEGISGNNKKAIPDEARQRQEERALEELEGALRQAARIREASRSGQLSDQERRARAGEAATLLMNLMGKFGDDDDDDESDVDEEDPVDSTLQT